MKTLLIFLASLAVLSCSSHKRSGAHFSSIKQEEISKNSNYDIKQAKAIIHNNEKNRDSNSKISAAQQKAIAKELEKVNKKKTNELTTKRSSDIGVFSFY